MYKGKMYPGLFIKRYHQLKGKDWLRHIPVEDRKAFSGIGMSCAPWNLPSLGGKARAEMARRLPNGRFAPNSQGENHVNQA